MRARLRGLMALRNINQAQLAEGLGTSKAVVNSWLVGQMKAGKRLTVFPSPAMLDALCAFFEVTPGELLEQEESTTPTGKTWRDVGEPRRGRPPKAPAIAEASQADGGR